ncbi:MAG TPA: cupredoxin domain-containing protein [Burkholderiales bacterium]|nr:cupredoxin domain-containing protein [Burkholderiales bacterium]
MSFRILSLSMLSAVLLQAAVASAADAVPVLTINAQQFVPQALTVPAGVKQKLIIRNTGTIPAEFESYDLSREVVVPARSEVTIYIGPLKTGRYQYFNDFNHAMQGTITVPAAGKGN